MEDGHGISEPVVVSLADVDRRKDPSGDYIAYHVVTKGQPGNGVIEADKASVWRRFSEFDSLRQYLVHQHTAMIVPPIPEKKINFKLSKMGQDKYDSQLVAKRRIGLQRFLTRLITHPVLRTSPGFVAFLTAKKWKEELVVTVNGEEQLWTPSLALMDMKALLAGKLRTPDRRFKDFKAYADALQENMTAILLIQGKLSKRTQELSSHLATLSTTFNDWSTKENIIGGVLQAVGEEMDCLVHCHDQKVQSEEEQVLLPLKEYADFADAIRQVVKQQELLQSDYERAAGAVSGKETAVEAVRNPGAEKGFRGFFSSLTGPSSEADKQAKEDQLNAQLVDLRATLTGLEAESEHFTADALADIARFHSQKLRDLKETFLAYAKLQQEHCRKSLEAWQRVKGHCKGQ